MRKPGWRLCTAALYALAINLFAGLAALEPVRALLSGNILMFAALPIMFMAASVLGVLVTFAVVAGIGRLSGWWRLPEYRWRLLVALGLAWGLTAIGTPLLLLTSAEWIYDLEWWLAQWTLFPGAGVPILIHSSLMTMAVVVALGWVRRPTLTTPNPCRG